MTKPTPVNKIELGLVIVGVVLLLAFLAGMFLIFWPSIHKQFFTQAPPEKTPAEMVDEAMAIPGAIVISPHRDLRELGIYTVTPNTSDVSVKLCAPGIAVHTRKNWCVWVLGECMYPHGVPTGSAVLGNSVVMSGAPSDVVMDGNYTSFISSDDGYSIAFNELQHCIADGNRPDPIDPRKLGAICDGRHEDIPFIVRAFELAAKTNGYVEIPSNCGIDPSKITIPPGDICDKSEQINDIPRCTEWHAP